MEDHLNEEEREKLRLENEIRKIKLSLEKGARFIESEDMPDLPPEVENDFLNYIEQIETFTDDSKKVSLYKKIGAPEYKKVETIEADEITQELDQLMDLLDRHGITVDSVYEVEDREMYRFITEDLFAFEIYDMPLIEGVYIQFNYEEFYPNQEEDIKKSALDFLENFFDLETNHYTYYAVMNNKWFEDFRQAYERFDIHALSVEEYEINENKVILHFEMDVDAYLDKKQFHTFKGLGTLWMSTDDYYTVQQVKFPEPR